MYVDEWTTHKRLIRVDTLMKRWWRSLQCLRDMIICGDITPLTCKQKTPSGFLYGHRVSMDVFEPRPWHQSGIEIEVYFDEDEVERIEQERPDVIAPPPAAPVAPALPAAWRAPQAVPLPWGAPSAFTGR